MPWTSNSPSPNRRFESTSASAASIWGGNTLFQIVNQDVIVGGIGLGDAAYEALLEHAKDEERTTIANWARQEMKGADGWSREAYESLIEQLRGDQCEK